MTSRLVLVVGGQKSGKSTYAIRRAQRNGGPVVVITPAAVRDEEFAARVARHRADRPAGWQTRESFAVGEELADAPVGATVIVDALDTWLAELLLTLGVDLDADGPSAVERVAVEDALGREVAAIVDAARARRGETIVIAGQPGLGVHASSAGARTYVDLHGVVAQVLSRHADEALLIVAGRPLPLPAPVAPAERQAVDTSTATPPRTRWKAGALPDISPIDSAVLAAARQHQAGLAKPPSSLGMLEDLAAQLAAISGRVPTSAPLQPAVVVAAGDHGVHTQGVSDWPQSVTTAMFRTVANGGAAINAIARTVGADIILVDAGMRGAASGCSAVDVDTFVALTHVRPECAVVDARRGPGTHDLRRQPAMTGEQCSEAVDAGVRVVTRLVDDGVDLVALGDLGIGNTTASSALIASATGRAPAEVTGPGANRDASRVAHKVEVIGDALHRHGDAADPWARLASLGGFEHAMLVGVMIGAASRRVPVVLDGVISAAAALIAVDIVPALAGYLIASHQSAEPGAAVALEALGLRPLLDLGLRLGEGTGALLAVPLVQAAARVTTDMSTLDEVLRRPTG
ncbi:MAG: nicotinate-nucleotide--dimethylbenzimidazole phosphoribosyltransferase [Nitriliruptoraceae bacterium]